MTQPSPLYAAVQRADATDVAKLLAGGADPNDYDMKRSITRPNWTI